MHQEALAFVGKAIAPINTTGMRVLDIGSFYVNGSPRALFAAAETYVGIDSRSGPCVDVVSSAKDYETDTPFDVVVSCETLEHAEPSEVIDCAWRVPTNLCISTLRTFRRVADPSTGSTQVEVWRSRAGVWTCIGNATMTIPFGTDLAQATITPGGPTPVEYRTLYKDDIVVALLVSSEPAARDLTVTIEFR